MSISTLRRQVKNVALNYTDAQVKVREATSNDPWGPTTALMSEIADMTHSPMQFTEIMSMLWKRLNDHGKNWRHVYKSLVLLDYLIKCGSERVAQQCKENIFSIETLKDFQHIEDNRDQGLNVRTKAKQMVTLLADEEKLKNERARFMLTRKRFMQNGSSGISSDGRRTMAGGSRHRTIDSESADPEFEEARPSSLGEEEMQLQIALALSREECEKEQELRRGDDIRLQIALEESKKEAMARSSSLGSPGSLDASQKPSTSKSQGALDDLLSLGLDDIFNSPQQQQAQQANPAGPSTSAQAFGLSQQQQQHDPWSPRPSTAIPMVAGLVQQQQNSFGTDPASIPPPVQNDPWASPAVPNPRMSEKSGASRELEDILAMSSGSMAASGTAQNDPWASFDPSARQQNSNSAGPMQIGGGGSALVGSGTQSVTMGQQRGNVITPESFLGENSALVNLDNLLGPINSQAQPKKGNAVEKAAAATNPFLIGSAASAAAATKNNPFLANERPSPSLNEMLQAKQQGGGGSASATNGPTTSSQQQQGGGAVASPFGPDGSLI